MAKKAAPLAVQRCIEGLHIYHQTWYRITLYDDGSIRIERPWCETDPRREWEPLVESNADLHRHLINLIKSL